MRDGTPAARAASTLSPATNVTRVLKVAPFATWSYEDAKTAMSRVLPNGFDVTQKYCRDKDHFQNGTQWIGPGTPASNSKIEEQFAPEDAIGEVLSNVENAFEEPQIGTAAIGGQEKPEELAEELDAIVTRWWEKRRMQEHIQERQRTAAWSGWGTLRLWIPHRYLVKSEDGIAVRRAATLEEALEFIHVSAPAPANSAIVFDADTMEPAAIYLDEEVEYVGDEVKTYQRAEIMYLDPNRTSDEDARTFIRVVYAEPSKAPRTASFPLNGRMLTAELRTRALINEPVRATQRQLNFLTSLTTRMAETAAFRERYTMNAKPQGLRIPYTEGDTLADGAFLERDDEGMVWEVIPQPRTLGAGTTTELVGLPQYDQTGSQKGYQTPSVDVIEPVDPTNYIQAANEVRRKILRMCGQGHLGGSSNAEVSGIAYEQARAVFEKDLEKRKLAEEGMLREFLTAAVSLAEYISSTPGKYTKKLRLTVNQHVNPGPRSPDLVRLDLEAYEAGVLSLETAQIRNGIQDTDAETEAIRRSTAHILNLLETFATSQSFTPESFVELMVNLGVPQDIISVLEAKEEPEPVVDQPIPPTEAVE